MASRLVLTLTAALALAAPAQAAPAHADRDGDGVFDDLEVAVRESKPSRDLGVIVILDSAATKARVGRLEEKVDSLGATHRFKLIDAFAAEVEAGEVRELAKQGDVVSIERNKKVRAFNVSAQESFGVTKARTDIPGLDGDGDGNAASYSAADLVAAVIDTGIQADHANLDGGKVLFYQDFTDGNYNDNDGAGVDNNGHGTHVSATIAGDGDGAGEGGRGVAPAAALVGLKVLGADGSGESKDVIAAIEWVVNNRATYGIEAVNMSLGSDGCSDGSDADSLAVNAAAQAGLVMAVAAGNEGPGQCSVGSPGAATGALTVGAMADLGAPGNIPGGFYLADFSSRGPTLDGRIKPDIVAPGVRVTSAWPNALDTEDGTQDGYLRISGTSMATPFVAGVALLLREENPALTPAQVKQAMSSTAIDWGSPGADNEYGAGRLDAYAALQTVEPSLSSPPGVPAHQLAQGSLSGTGAQTIHNFTVNSNAFAVGLTLTLDDPTADFDLYVTEPDGDPVTVFDRMGAPKTGAVGFGRSDAVFLPIGTTGPLVLRIVSFEGSGGWLLDISNGQIEASAPTVGTAPTISGAPIDGETLTANNGQWNGTGPMTFAYQWERCSADGSTCSNIDGATGQTYVLGNADVGARLRVTVTATNSVGSASSTSVLTGPVGAGPPTSTAAPAITGTTVEGQTLTSTDGTWSGTNPMTFTRQWFRCGASGGACLAILDATAATYVLTAADVGSSIRVRVTATNEAGTATRDSEATALVRERPEPRGVTVPTLSGAARDGSTLTVSDGDWDGAAPITLAYQWLRCDSTAVFCDPIGGATANRYPVRARDIGSRIRARVTGTTSAGSAMVTTAATGRVSGVAPANGQAPTLKGRASRGKKLTVRKGRWSGSAPITFTFRWLRCNRRGTRCKPIRGADERTYQPTVADAGRRLRARVTASNVAGTRAVRTGASARLPEAPGRRRS